MAREGTWTFDGDVLRIVPGRGRGVHKLRQQLGEVAVPLAALAGIAYEPGRKKGGRIRLRLRSGADPLSQVAGGWLDDAADPYQLTVEDDRTGVAEYVAEEVRNALLLDEIPDGPADRYLLPGPAVPLTASSGEGTATFDGEHIRLDHNWMAQDSKQAMSPRQFALADLAGLDWKPSAGLENGYLRFRVAGETGTAEPKYDPHTVVLTWGTQKETATTVLLAAAIAGRRPHPARPAESPVSGPDREVEPPTGAADEDHDALLRRLRELGDLHRDGVLTDEEFASAKQAVLSRM